MKMGLERPYPEPAVSRFQDILQTLKDLRSRPTPTSPAMYPQLAGMPDLPKKGSAERGIFGLDTTASVMFFQRTVGLDPDGVAGAATFAKMDQMLPLQIVGAQAPPQTLPQDG
jgi:peptidoglycan hydrolase-like protein with peptidoglycan-binding domain